MLLRKGTAVLLSRWRNRIKGATLTTDSGGYWMRILTFCHMVKGEFCRRWPGPVCEENETDLWANNGLMRPIRCIMGKGDSNTREFYHWTNVLRWHNDNIASVWDIRWFKPPTVSNTIVHFWIYDKPPTFADITSHHSVVHVRMAFKTKQLLPHASLVDTLLTNGRALYPRAANWTKSTSLQRY